MKHLKHLSPPKFTQNKYHDRELSFVGAPCSLIKELLEYVIPRLDDFKTLYIEARHDEEKKTDFQYDIAGHDSSGVRILSGEYTEMYSGPENEYDDKMLTHHYDAVLVNGNHFSAAHQVVFLYPEKEKSLIKRIDELTDVKLLIDCGVGHLPEEVLTRYPAYKDVPTLPMSDREEITNKCRQLLHDLATTPLFGLVLTGGKSTRMGVSKANLHYYDQPQWKYMYSLLQQYCDRVFLSAASDTELEGYRDEDRIEDVFLNLGPMSGILSTFMKYPNAALLVVACDLPLVDEELLEELVSNRDSTMMATTFAGDNEDHFPEPLIAIWEPKSYPRLLDFLGIGYSCPRKLLINSPCKVLHTSDLRKLANANTPEDFKVLQEEIAGKPYGPS